MFEQVIYLKITLRYLGVPLRDQIFIFGDNDAVVNSSMTPHAKIYKRHVSLSFYRVREAIVAKIITYHFIREMKNPANI